MRITILLLSEIGWRLIYVSFFRNQVDGALAAVYSQSLKVILLVHEVRHQQHPGLVTARDMLHQLFDVYSTVWGVCEKYIVLWVTRGIFPYFVTILLFVLDLREA